ncbi:MAG: hypothetical protein V4462_08425 [Pseudomonadota bacterium]
MTAPPCPAACGADTAAMAAAAPSGRSSATAAMTAAANEAADCMAGVSSSAANSASVSTGSGIASDGGGLRRDHCGPTPISSRNTALRPVI